MLLQHELTNILIMLKLEHLTNADVVNKTSVLQVDILADDISLSKIIKILALIYFVYQRDLQVSDFQITLSDSMLVCIFSAVILS